MMHNQDKKATIKIKINRKEAGKRKHFIRTNNNNQQLHGIYSILFCQPINELYPI